MSAGRTTCLIKKMFLHMKCRYQFYCKNKSSVLRFPVPDDKVSWEEPFAEYKPTCYTADVVSSCPVWADKELTSSTKFSWNALEGNVDRRSHEGDYKVDKAGYPLNPFGRTGISGRGYLGRWGPNHAADPIVTRWKTEPGGNDTIKINGQPVLQFVAILRGDCKEWAIPGGMVDPGEKVSKTLQREFFEEALDASEAAVKEKVKAFFDSSGKAIYSGYVDDPRNTDNSWMETVVYNFHDKDNSVFGNIELKAGDDAVNVKWMDLSCNLQLYASHTELLKKVAELHGAHW